MIALIPGSCLRASLGCNDLVGSESAASFSSFTVDLQTLQESRYYVTIHHLAKGLVAVGSAVEAKNWL